MIIGVEYFDVESGTNFDSLREPKTMTLQDKVERSFRDIPPKDAADENLADILDCNSTYGSFGWDTLLKSMRVMLISEAGSGKTFECKEKCKELNDRGEKSFFIELSQLSLVSFDDLLSEEEYARFKEWRETPSSMATFFLDSIDELKITPLSFDLALKKVSKSLKGCLKRARIVVTTRPTTSDEAIFRSNLDLPSEPPRKPNEDDFANAAMRTRVERVEPRDEIPLWRIAALTHLSENQILQFVTLQGVQDSDTLLENIRERNAQSFARRPQDLIELCADWKGHRRIRQHAEQVTNNIEVKLQSSRSKELTALSVDKARVGARRLALAALLTRKLTIRNDAQASSASLDARVILSDWSSEEREVLLQRPLFGFATYSAMRFHHRSVLEYLAAEELSEMIRRGVSVRLIRRILFSTTHSGVQALKPSLRPVAAWLSLQSEEIFERVVNHDAAVLLRYGAPDGYNTPQKKRILRALVEQQGKGGWRGLSIHGPQLARFASADLESDIKELWAKGIENPEVKVLVLSLIGAGKIVGCADIAHEIAFDTSADDLDRQYAVVALSDLGDRRLEEILESMERDPKRWSDGLVRNVITALSLQTLSVARLCSLLKNVRTSEKGAGGFRWYLPQMIQNAGLGSQDLNLLRQSLTDLARENASWDSKWPHYTTSRSYLLPALICACQLLWERGDRSEGLIESSVVALRLAHDNGAPDGATQLRRHIESLRGDQRAVAFWKVSNFIDSFQRSLNPFERFWAIAGQGPLDILIDFDQEWIFSALGRETVPPRDRELLLDIAKRLDPNGEHYADHLEGLKPYIVDSPDLHALLQADIERAHNSSVELKKWLRDQEEQRERQAVHDKERAEARASWIGFLDKLRKSPHELFDDAHEESTSRHLWHVMTGHNDDSRRVGWDKKFLEDHIGTIGAQLARKMFMRVWRKMDITLPSERSEEERNVHFVIWGLGEVALWAESDDSTWASSLSSEDATKAARFALLQRNTFPEWLDALSNAHPNEVSAVIGAELAFELNRIGKPNEYAMMVQCLRHGPASLRDRLAPFVKCWLVDLLATKRIGLLSQNALKQVHDVLHLLIDENATEHLQFIKERCVGEIRERAIPLHVRTIWLPTLMAIEPAEATKYLEHFCLTAKVPKRSEWLTSTFGSIDRGLTVRLDNEAFTPQLLLKLIRLAYAAAPSGPDEETQFDGAQQVRSALLSALLEQKGVEAWMAKMELATDPKFVDFRSRAIALANEKASEEADVTTQTEDEVRTLMAADELTPKTRDEIFDLMMYRLDDIEDELKRDASPRSHWAGIGDERIMRRAITRELQSSAHGAYSVAQESVTAEEKETDIRLVARNGVQAVIELKLGDKDRSANDLAQDLREQLVGKYMAPEERRAGCFLITLAEARTWRHPDTNKTLDFNELIRFLEGVAADLVKSMNHELRLSVRGLDLRAPQLIERLGAP